MTTALYYSPGACSLAAHIALQEIGAPFELRLADARGKRLADNPEYLRTNPRGRIPALDVDGQLLTENAAIMAWLALQHPEAGLLPADPMARARCLEMLAWLSSTVHVAIAGIWRPERFADGTRHAAALEARGRETVSRCFTELEAVFAARGYAAGPAYSAADPFPFVLFRWGKRLGLDMPTQYPAWSAVIARLWQRPAVQRAVEAEGLACSEW
jgi:glutathione S-transferase